MSKYALLIGINYFGTENRLYGCINDVIVMRKYLIEKRGYLPKNIKVLRDDDSSFLLPNKNNILTKFRELIDTANTNKSSEIFFHYSGHGTYGQDNNRDEKDGKDEYICPVDFNFIRDDDIRSILSKLNNTTTLLGVMDCCHSATNMDLPYLYNKIGSKIIMLEDNSKQYANLLGKNIYSLSGCRDDQTSADAYNVYSVLTDLSDNKYNITDNNKSGGALTSTLLQLLNKTNTANFINILDQLQINIKNSYYTQIPLLSSSKNIIPMPNKKPIKKPNKKVIKKVNLQIKRNFSIKQKILIKPNLPIKRNLLIKRNLPIKRKLLIKQNLSKKRFIYIKI